MLSQAQFHVDRHTGAALVEVRGELDITNADDFEALLEEAAANGGPVVVVSLERATYFDSRGIHALLRAAERLRRSDRRLLVVSPAGTPPRRILDIAGVPQIIPMFDTSYEAMAAAAG